MSSALARHLPDDVPAAADGCAAIILAGDAWHVAASAARHASPAVAPAARQRGGTVTFTDVTAAAGLLRARNVSGSPDNKQFLLEEMGGGAAFFDYDHDGWLDIFLVNGTQLRSEGARQQPASYLFHNNRDGTFTDVTEEGRPDPFRLGSGLLRRRLRQRRLRRSLRHLLGPQRALPQQRRRHVHRRVREGRRGGIRHGAGARDAASSTTTATGFSICSSPAT